MSWVGGGRSRVESQLPGIQADVIDEQGNRLLVPQAECMLHNGDAMMQRTVQVRCTGGVMAVGSKRTRLTGDHSCAHSLRVQAEWTAMMTRRFVRKYAMLLKQFQVSRRRKMMSGDAIALSYALGGKVCGTEDDRDTIQAAVAL